MVQVATHCSECSVLGAAGVGLQRTNAALIDAITSTRQTPPWGRGSIVTGRRIKRSCFGRRKRACADLDAVLEQ
jgi:hypothetical protein